ncbi:hypothetical protein ACVV2G_05645 [Streptomyces ziwulingensis]
MSTLTETEADTEPFAATTDPVALVRSAESRPNWASGPGQRLIAGEGGVA